MSKTIEYKINVDAGSSVKTLGQLEQELAQINEELKDVQVGSQRFDELTKSAQQTTKEINKISKQIEGITGEDKIRGLDGAIKTLAGSTQATVGALGLLGIESEKFGEFEEKAASAIAFGIGLKDVSEGVAQLGQFIGKLPGPTKIAAAAQRAFNLVLNANPIGLVVTAIGLVVAGFVLFNDKVKSVIKSIEPLNKILQKTVGFFRSIGENLGLVATEEEIAAKKTKEATEQRIKDLNNEIKVRKAAGEDTVALEREKYQKLIELTEEGSQEQKDAIANQQEFEAGLRKKASDEAVKIEEEKQKKIKEAQEKAAEDAKKKQEEADKKAEEAKKKEEDRQQNILDILEEYRQKQKDIDATTEVDKVNLEEERQLDELEKLKASEEEKQAIRDFYAQRRKEAEDEDAKIRKEKEAEIAQQTIDTLLDQIDKEFQLEMDRVKMKQFAVDSIIGLVNAETAIGRAALVAKQILNAKELVIEAKAALSSINLNAAKAAADTSTGFAATLKAGFPQNVPLLIAYAAQALSIGSAIKQAVSGAKQQIGSVGGVSAPSVPTTSVSAPSTPTTSTPTLEQQAAAQQVSQKEQLPIQTYVLSGDVTSAQEASRKIRQRRTIGR